jgi:hypothetical protein
MRWHFHLKPIGNLMWIEPDRTPHSKKRNATVLDLFIQSSNSDTEQTGKFVNRKSLFSGAQLLDKGHLMRVSGGEQECQQVAKPGWRSDN